MIISRADSPIFDARILVFRLSFRPVLEDLLIAFLGIQEVFGLFRGHSLGRLLLGGGLILRVLLPLLLLRLLLLARLRLLGIGLVLLVLLLLIRLILLLLLRL